VCGEIFFRWLKPNDKGYPPDDHCCDILCSRSASGLTVWLMPTVGNKTEKGGKQAVHLGGLFWGVGCD